MSLINSLTQNINNRNDKIDILITNITDIKNKNSILTNKNTELILKNTRLTNDIKKLKTKSINSSTEIINSSNDNNNDTNILGIDEIYDDDINDKHKLFKSLNCNTININDLEYKCWKNGCNEASIIAPSGKYQNIYCYKHSHKCDDKPICEIMNCSKLAEYGSSNSINIPNRCLDHCKNPSTLSLVSFKCSKRRCKNKAIFSSDGYTSGYLFCEEHKKDDYMEIKLYCNHYKCRNSPIYGYKDDKYPLVCKNHYNNLV